MKSPVAGGQYDARAAPARRDGHCHEFSKGNRQRKKDDLSVHSGTGASSGHLDRHGHRQARGRMDEAQTQTKSRKFDVGFVVTMIHPHLQRSRERLNVSKRRQADVPNRPQVSGIRTVVCRVDSPTNR